MLPLYQDKKKPIPTHPKKVLFLCFFNAHHSLFITQSQPIPFCFGSPCDKIVFVMSLLCQKIILVENLCINFLAKIEYHKLSPPKQKDFVDFSVINRSLFFCKSIL